MKRKFFNLLFCIAALMLAASCSNSHTMKVLKQIPGNADIVVVGDVNTIVESAGGEIDGSKIKLPSFIADILGEDYKSLNDKLKEYSINPEAAARFGYWDDKRYNGVVVFSLTDPDKFIRAINKEEYEKKDEADGVSYYVKESERFEKEIFAVSGNYAYHASYYYYSYDEDESSAVKACVSKMKLIFEDKDESKFASTTFGKFIGKGNAGGISIRIPAQARKEMREAGMPSEYCDMFNSVICVRGDINKDNAELEIKAFSVDGKELDNDWIKNLCDTNARINPEALKYLSPYEQLVMAFELKDFNWDKAFDIACEMSKVSNQEKAAISVIKGYLTRLDGTIAIGWGVMGNLDDLTAQSLAFNPTKHISLTMVLEIKDGKSKSVISDFRSLAASAGVPVEDFAGGFRISGGGMNIYVKAAGDFLVISTQEIKEGSNATVEHFNFDREFAAAALYLPKGNAIMRQLDLKYDVMISISSDPKKNISKMRLSIEGGKDEGIVGKVFRIIGKLADTTNQIDRNLYGSSEEETVEADTTVVEAMEDNYDEYALVDSTGY